MGDTVCSEVEVVEIQTEKNRVRLHTVCTDQDGATLVEGNAVVSLLEAPNKG